MKIERSLRGILAASFLFLNLESAHSAELLINADSFSSRGILNENYWASQELSITDDALIAYADFSRRIEFKLLDNNFFLESHTVASMSTTTNSLVMLSKNDTLLRKLTDHQSNLSGKLLSYGYDAIGITLTSKSENSNLSWAFSPKILRMTNFKSDSGSGLFSKQGNYYHLEAETNSIGYWEYGFFENRPKPIKFGSGIAADLSLKYQENNLTTQINVLNIYSRVSNNSLFYNTKKYQTNSIDTVILSNDLPAMSGEYGQSDFVSSLPLFSTVTLEYADPRHHLRGAIGIDTLDGISAGWFALTFQRDAIHLSAKTYGLKKIALNGQIDNLWLCGLSLGVGLESNLRGEWQFNALRVGLVF